VASLLGRRGSAAGETGGRAGRGAAPIGRAPPAAAANAAPGIAHAQWDACAGPAAAGRAHRPSRFSRSVATQHATLGSHLSVGPSAPLLVQLAARPWGAAPVLAAAALPLPPGPPPRAVAVVRQPFAAATDALRPLAAIVARVAPGAAGGAGGGGDAAAACVVDEYTLTPGASPPSYALATPGTPLATALRRAGVRVSHAHDVGAAAAAALNSARAAARGVRQSTNEVLMVAPTAFGFNAQAAEDNFFMHANPGGSGAGPGANGASSSPPLLPAAALAEFAGLHRALTDGAGVRVTLFEHAPEHGTPDAVFPNNWFSTHAAGEGAGGVAESTLVYYPLKCPNRQAERRGDARAALEARGYGRVVDLAPAEAGAHPASPAAPAYFEGTGVLVLDRVNGVAYVSLSERADERLARAWADAVGYRELVTFRASDAHKQPIYHTNVMMAVGSDVAVVCLESVRDDRERERLRASLARHHAIVDVTLAQVEAMCGNVLELEDGRGLPVLAMSTRAHAAFGRDGRKALLKHVADLVHAPIDTIERVGGGGVRCSLAELF